MRRIKNDDLVFVPGVGYCLVDGEPAGSTDEMLFVLWRNGIRYLRREEEIGRVADRQVG